MHVSDRTDALGGRKIHRTTLIGLCVATWLVAAATRAQQPSIDDDAGVPERAMGLVAPELIDSAPPARPSEVGSLAQAASVRLQLTIDSAGQVAEIVVQESAGSAFDAAARDAAQRYRFHPATRDGVPIGARVSTLVVFEPDPAPVLVIPAPPPPSAATEVPPPADGAPTEVTVQGQRSESERLAESAEAVTVQDLTTARRESSSMGEVLARVPGVSVQRSGGLGSTERLALVGIDNVALFVDGVPLGFSFFPYGVSSFSVNLSEQLEIYSGVVPVRFGGAALGGAINIVTNRDQESNANASVELSSFGTQRVTGGGTYRHEATDFIVNGSGFYDHSNNDYEIDARVADDNGRVGPARVSRFHDDYRVYGGTLETGVVDKSWARELLVRGYAVRLDQEIQSNLTATVPYGEAVQDQMAWGLNARYSVDALPKLRLDAMAAYTYSKLTYFDPGDWVYNWRGERIRERADPGPNDPPKGDDTESWSNNVLGRVSARYQFSPAHALTAVTTPTYVFNTGDDNLIENRDDPFGRVDTLAEKKRRWTLISGVEYEVNLLPAPSDWGSNEPAANEAKVERQEADYRLQNLLFAKHYYYDVSTNRGEATDGASPIAEPSSTFGVGDGIRMRWLREFMVKVSYEFATRLPESNEIFGDGAFVRDALGLRPEISHNVNLSPVFDVEGTSAGDFHLEVNGFLRDVKDQIASVRSDRYTWSANVGSARSLGVAGEAKWTSPREYVELNASTTFQDFRNTSNTGPFGEFEGQRVPNRPWLFASGGARLHFERLFVQDTLELFYTSRYVHSFYVGWEDLGRRSYKRTVPFQLTHSLGATYVVKALPATTTLTLEVQNVTDEPVYDNFGIERPGRIFALKLTCDLR